MNVLIDMNLSPEWVAVFEREGWQASHWSMVGAFNAPDGDLMHWARMHGHIVFTHDLDFGTLLALTQADGPSVIQIRNEDSLPDVLGELVVFVMKRYEQELRTGALITIDKRRSRVRMLPI